MHRNQIPEHLGTDVDGFDLNQRKVHLFLAKRSLPGPNYYNVLHWIHRALTPATYVEIGVHEGDSLQEVLPSTECVGIDPSPSVRYPLSDRMRLFRTTSNEFFANHDLTAVLGGRAFDLAFIDGLHLFEQVLLDFFHLERHAGRRSAIVLHDCIPLDALTSGRTRQSHFFSGDAWKATLCLRECRPDLTMVIVPTAPTGLCLITGLNPARASSGDDYDRLVATYRDLSYEDYRMRIRQMPPKISNAEEAVYAYVRQELMAGAVPTCL